MRWGIDGDVFKQAIIRLSIQLDLDGHYWENSRDALAKARTKRAGLDGSGGVRGVGALNFGIVPYSRSQILREACDDHSRINGETVAGQNRNERSQPWQTRSIKCGLNSCKRLAAIVMDQL